MTAYPPRGLEGWDDELKTYIDGGDFVLTAGFYTTVTQITTGTTASVVPSNPTGFIIKVGDMLLSTNAGSYGFAGRVTAVASQTSVTVSYAGTLAGVDGSSDYLTAVTLPVTGTTSNTLVSIPANHTLKIGDQVIVPYGVVHTVTSLVDATHANTTFSAIRTGSSIWVTGTLVANSGSTSAVNPATISGRQVRVGDIVISSNAGSVGVFGTVTAVSSQSSVTVLYSGTLSGGAATNTVAVSAVSTVNVTVSAYNFTTFMDGVTLTSGVSTLLLKDQTAPAENGLYLFNGSGAALTRLSPYGTTAANYVNLQVVCQSTIATRNANSRWWIAPSWTASKVVGTDPMPFGMIFDSNATTDAKLRAISPNPFPGLYLDGSGNWSVPPKPKVTLYWSSGTHTWTTGALYADVEVLGAGGAGGGYVAGAALGGSGGGGSYAKVRYQLQNYAGGSYTGVQLNIIVGNGGTGTQTGAGTQGGSSSVTSASSAWPSITAYGGGGGGTGTTGHGGGGGGGAGTGGFGGNGGNATTSVNGAAGAAGAAGTVLGFAGAAGGAGGIGSATATPTAGSAGNIISALPQCSSGGGGAGGHGLTATTMGAGGSSPTGGAGGVTAGATFTTLNAGGVNFSSNSFSIYTINYLSGSGSTYVQFIGNGYGYGGGSERNDIGGWGGGNGLVRVTEFFA